MSFVMPSKPREAVYTAPFTKGLFIDTTMVNQGYVTAGYVGAESGYNRLKFQVYKGEQAYNYDFIPSAKPIHVPINMGSGEYVFRFMENIGGSTYAQRMSVTKQVKLINQRIPYTVPNLFCDYNKDSKCVAQARAICNGCVTELAAARLIVRWVSKHVAYDYKKADELAKSKGYVPHPDVTMKERKGVCFDYASLAAAMLRSVNIPCRVITGYIDGELYHAWISAYVSGRWRRYDPTLKSAGKSSKTYRNRFIY